MFSNKRAAVILRLGLIIALGGLYWSYPQSARADTIYKSGHMTSNETWTAGNVYVIQDHVTVDSGVALTIQGGAIVKFAGSKVLGVNGVLKVQGTAANPVYITSLKDDTVGGDTNNDGNATAPDRGDWGQIAFLDSSVDSENLIEHAVIRYGGYFDNNWLQYYGDCGGCKYWGTIRFHSASPTVRNTTVEQSRGYALSASVDSFPVVSGNTLTGNEGNGLEIRGGTLSIAAPATRHWSSTDVVYVLTGYTTIGSGVTLIIDPGVMVKFAGNILLGVNGVLKVQGTAANPVYITSLKDDTVGGDTNNDGNATAPDRGDWGQIAFLDSSVDSENLIEHAVIRYGGYFDNNWLQYYGDCGGCKYWGTIRFHSASPTVRNTTVEQSRGYALSASVDSFPVVSGNTLTGNEGNGLEIRGGTLSIAAPATRHWSSTDVVYVLTGYTTIGSGVTLIVDPGVMVKFAGNKLLGVNGVLKVQGTAANPVYITSLKDDTVGGDTNNDGNATAPDRGNWGQIAFLDSSVDSENLIEHAIIRYGGYFDNNWLQYYGDCGGCKYNYMVWANRAGLTMQHSLLEYSYDEGLRISYPDDAPNVMVHYCTFRLNNGSGVRVVRP